MINNKLNPIEWSSLLYELEDAKEHLESLIAQLSQNGKIDEQDYMVQMGHIYAHLNRSWNSRNNVGECRGKEREVFTSFPKDIEPCG